LTDILTLLLSHINFKQLATTNIVSSASHLINDGIFSAHERYILSYIQRKALVTSSHPFLIDDGINSAHPKKSIGN